MLLFQVTVFFFNKSLLLFIMLAPLCVPMYHKSRRFSRTSNLTQPQRISHEKMARNSARASHAVRCSFNTVKKWIDKMDWERDDETIRIVDFFLR